MAISTLLINGDSIHTTETVLEIKKSLSNFTKKINLIEKLTFQNNQMKYQFEAEEFLITMQKSGQTQKTGSYAC